MSLLHDVLAEDQLSSSSLTVVRIVYELYTWATASTPIPEFRNTLMNLSIIMCRFCPCIMLDLNCSTNYKMH